MKLNATCIASVMFVPEPLGEVLFDAIPGQLYRLKSELKYAQLEGSITGTRKKNLPPKPVRRPPPPAMISASARPHVLG